MKEFSNWIGQRSAKLSGIAKSGGYRALWNLLSKNIRKAKITILDKGLDSLFGIDTSGILMPGQFRVEGPNGDLGNHYEATPWRSLSKILGKVQCNHAEYTFVDFGCGKGRTLVEASTFPFRAVVGVEFSPDLCDDARSNMASLRFLPRRAREVQVLCQDAATYDLPETPCILYFYNPFGPAIMKLVAERTAASCAANPRDIIAVFFARNSREVFEQLTFLGEVESGWITDALGGRPREYAILRTIEASAAGGLAPLELPSAAD